MRAAYATDKGRTHAENDDSLLVDPDRGIFLLADGMSGCQGKIASELTTRTAHDFLKNHIMTAAGEHALENLLAETFSHAHNVVQEASRRERKLRGMGTTLLMLVIQGDKACIGHVGDSRAYIIRNEITQLTTDHARDNCIGDNFTLRELFFLSPRRILAQAIGASKKIDHETIPVKFQEGDRILLCSDGLTDMLSDEAIRQIIAIHRDDLQTAADSLVEAANRMGGKDNISVILVTI